MPVTAIDIIVHANGETQCNANKQKIKQTPNAIDTFVKCSAIDTIDLCYFVLCDM